MVSAQARGAELFRRCEGRGGLLVPLTANLVGDRRDKHVSAIELPR